MKEHPYTKIFERLYKNKIGRIISAFFILIVFVFGFYDNLKEIYIDFFSVDDNSIKEILIFTDSTYNVLILPFNNYQDNPTNRVKIEQALEDRLYNLVNENNLTSEIRSKAKIACDFAIPENLSKDSIKNIGIKYKANLIIYGDIYDVFNKGTKQTNIKYIILNEEILPFKKEGETGLIEITSLAEIKEGSLINDIDYMVYSIFCSEQINNKKLDDAVKIANLIINKFSGEVFNVGNSFLMAILGDNHFYRDEINKAQQFYLASLRYYYENSDVHNNLGVIYQDYFFNYDSAKIEYINSLSFNPNNEIAHNNLGTYYYHLKDYVLAIKHYKISVSLNPIAIIPIYNLGLVYQEYCKKTNNFYCDSAKFNFLLCLNLLPKEEYSDKISSIYINLGVLYMDRFSDYDSARIFFYNALSIDKNCKFAHHNLGLLNKKELNYDLAKLHYLMELKIYPNSSDTHNNLGILYKDFYNKPDSAKIHFIKAIKSDSNFALAYNNLGLIYHFNFPNYDSAQICYKKALSINDKYIDPYYHLGDLFAVLLLNKEKAKYFYQEGLKIDPNDAYLNRNLGSLYALDFKDYNLALKHFELAIKTDPNMWEAYISKAKTLRIIGETSLAREYYIKAYNINPELKTKDLDNYYGIK